MGAGAGGLFTPRVATWLAVVAAHYSGPVATGPYQGRNGAMPVVAI